jgi:hypothetical protein
MASSSITGTEALRAVANALERQDKYLAWFKKKNAALLEDPFSEETKKANGFIADYNELVEAYQYLSNLVHYPPPPTVEYIEVEAPDTNWSRNNTCHLCKEDIESRNLFYSYERRQPPKQVGSIIHLALAHIAPSKEAFIKAFPQYKKEIQINDFVKNGV